MRIRNVLKNLPRPFTVSTFQRKTAAPRSSNHVHFPWELLVMDLNICPCQCLFISPTHLSGYHSPGHSLPTGTPALLSELELQGANSHRGLPAENDLSSWLAPLCFGNSQRGLFFLAFKCHLNNTPALFYIYMQVHQLNYGFPADCQSWSWYSYIDIWSDAVLSCQTRTFTLFSRWLIIKNCSCNRYAVSSINIWAGGKVFLKHSPAS